MLIYQAGDKDAEAGIKLLQAKYKGEAVFSMNEALAFKDSPRHLIAKLLREERELFPDHHRLTILGHAHKSRFMDLSEDETVDVIKKLLISLRVKSNDSIIIDLVCCEGGLTDLAGNNFAKAVYLKLKKDYPNLMVTAFTNVIDERTKTAHAQTLSFAKDGKASLKVHVSELDDFYLNQARFLKKLRLKEAELLDQNNLALKELFSSAASQDSKRELSALGTELEFISAPIVKFLDFAIAMSKETETVIHETEDIRASLDSIEAFQFSARTVKEEEYKTTSSTTKSEEPENKYISIKDQLPVFSLEESAGEFSNAPPPEMPEQDHIKTLDIPSAMLEVYNTTIAFLNEYAKKLAAPSESPQAILLKKSGWQAIQSATEIIKNRIGEAYFFVEEFKKLTAAFDKENHGTNDWEKLFVIQNKINKIHTILQTLLENTKELTAGVRKVADYLLIFEKKAKQATSPHGHFSAEAAPKNAVETKAPDVSSAVKNILKGA